MANHIITKRKINSERLRRYISEQTSIRKIGKLGEWSEKPIRRALADEYMSLDLIIYLANLLNVPADYFADVPFKFTLDELF